MKRLMTLCATGLFAIGLSGQPAPAAEGSTDQPTQSKNPWRGSVLSIGNAVSLYSFNRSLDLTYNPYDALSIGIAPRVWFGEHLYLAASLEVQRELTEADNTTYEGEILLGDLEMSLGYARAYTIPWLGIDLSPSLQLLLPTSKASQARNLTLGGGPELALARTFSFARLGRFTLGYSGRFSPYLNRTTTMTRQSPLIPTCSLAREGCASFLNTGLRNSAFRLRHGLNAGWSPLAWLALSLNLGQIVDWLYPIEKDDPRITLSVADPARTRHLTYFGVETAVSPVDFLEVALGYSVISPELAADSTHHSPFYNRYSMVSAELRLKLDGMFTRMGQ